MKTDDGDWQIKIWFQFTCVVRWLYWTKQKVDFGIGIRTYAPKRLLFVVPSGSLLCACKHLPRIMVHFEILSTCTEFYASNVPMVSLSLLVPRLKLWPNDASINQSIHQIDTDEWIFYSLRNFNLECFLRKNLIKWLLNLSFSINQVGVLLIYVEEWINLSYVASFVEVTAGLFMSQWRLFCSNRFFSSQNPFRPFQSIPTILSSLHMWYFASIPKNLTKWITQPKQLIYQLTSWDKPPPTNRFLFISPSIVFYNNVYT